MLKELYRMAVFAKVVECGSFSKAAAALELGKSVVSAHVAALERRSGAQLINRSTRALSLTQEGKTFYESCRQMVAAGESAFAAVESQRVQATGSVRLTSSYNLGVSFLIAQLTLFRQAHPEVLFDLVLEDSVSNLIEEHFDLAVRVGRLPDTGLFATEIGVCRMVLCASREFVRAHPEIAMPEDLLRVPWVSITQLAHPERLDLVHGATGQTLALRLPATVKTHAGIAAREFVRSGVGVSLLPDYAVREDLQRGDLVHLLPQWKEANVRPISALFPSRDRLPTRVRLLIEFLRKSFAERVATA
jgi:DNA-binding transcriptional LysR family regulator